MEEQALLGWRARKNGRRAALAFAVTASAITMILCGVYTFTKRTHRTALETSIAVNCDGSIDVMSSAPCLESGPTMATYTSLPPALPYADPVVVTSPSWGLPAVPVGPNAYQYPTVWQGDNMLSGGQLQWAAEDAAQHALNLNNWRIKILKAKHEQARLSNAIMRESASGTDLGDDYAEYCNDATDLKSIRGSVSKLAGDTSKAIKTLENEVKTSKVSKPVSQNLRRLQKDTDKELSKIMAKLNDLSKDSA
ncbi:hypothetical protein GUITHDRAFT_138626 [Guillardia theta CCMP2712]|uniref:Uncharacterized protein n=1 Tax=Guillardia theta (strain CCMP2712) TaxID=905079 RepID=L1JCB4_GUITC|nr:hypothetical protein GUITHDRAFT_138626 [Guillardia theta CCMP2712]EKX45749.1 hypothetical protein GUITHDRAFT_138626 [Guillardia theta CCMP2712]|eukprot:XP_005832729.1 hypothetical protein GUITHDRAFT_138626 [Guillardia theta CCMP2712]